ncbi:MAG: hypothetical protein HYU76_14110 [Betaproteobacteria bacterium]|nr:hypothetical protein [Betaproteobacteria bacterium]
METTKAGEPSLVVIVTKLARHYLGGRRGLIVLGVLAVGAAMVFNWGWLVAVGVAPLLLALAPCAAMCALGLCANKLGARAEGSDAAKDATSRQSADVERTSHANPIEKG